MPNIQTFTGNRPAITTVGGDAESVTALVGGVEANMPTLSIRGGTFRLFHEGEELVVRGSDNMPAKLLDIVMLRASNNISRSFYRDQYQEGKRQRPTCFSTDGVRPDPSSEQMQSTLCASCPHMKFDQPTASGGRTKRCSDSRLLAFSAVGDLGNAAFGMPCTIRLSYRNMQALKQYGEFLRDDLSINAYNQVVTRISFDPSAAFPLLLFEAIRAVSQQEYDQYSKYYDKAREADILEKVLRETPSTATNVARTDVMSGPTAVATPAQAPQAPQTPAAGPTMAATPAQAPQVVQTPAAGPTTTVSPAEQPAPWGVQTPAVPPATAQPAAVPAFGMPPATPATPATPAAPAAQVAPAAQAAQVAPATPAAEGTGVVIDQITPNVPEVVTATDAVNKKLDVFLAGADSA